METIAVVLRQPEQIELNRLALTPPTADDVVVDVDWSGVSTGTGWAGAGAGAAGVEGGT